MRNARKYDDRITVGSVPDQDDLNQLKEIGFKTLVDLRDEDEKFGGYVAKRTTALGLRYISIPIRRDDITVEDAVRFFNVVYEKGSAPIYAFSRFGKRPLALLLLLETVSKGEPLYKVYQRAATFGLDLEGDITLKAFLVEFYNAHWLEPIAENLAKLRPDLFAKKP
ncbi:MAG: hypothetical protein HY897_22515 [Deltaproteobacteria bacterium]|nr:hypothetical protein [Deltaproteobacteria bacterium]